MSQEQLTHIRRWPAPGKAVVCLRVTHLLLLAWAAIACSAVSEARSALQDLDVRDERPRSPVQQADQQADDHALAPGVVLNADASQPDRGTPAFTDSSGSAPQTTDPAANSARSLEQVIVTARRRAENLERVPIAISALSSADLREYNITSTQDLSLFVPSLAINNSAGLGSAFVLRGQGTIQDAPPGVVAYFAEVPLISAQTALGPVQGGRGSGQFYDLTSVDVLKGPQGTLFGRNTTGGAVLFTPQAPTNNLEGYGQLTLGEYDWREFEGAVNAPMIDDKLLVRLACDVSARHGYTRDVGPFFPGRDYDDRNYQAFRVSVVFRPLQHFENYLIASGLHVDQHGQGGSAYAVNPSSLAAAAFPGIFTYLAEQQARGPRYTSLSTYQIDREWIYGIFDIARWNFGDQLALRNIAAYQADESAAGIVDADYTSFPLQDISVPKRWGGTGEQYSEELQLSGTSRNRSLQWVVGGYFQYDRPTDIPEIDVAQPAQLSAGVYAPIRVVVQGARTERSYAAYGQATYDLSDWSHQLDHLKLTAGVRYTWDYASEYSNLYIPTFGNVCAETSGAAPNCVLSSAGRFRAPTWTLGLDDQLTPGTLVYVTSRRGYKSGGFNLITPLHSLYSAYQPEHVTDVEIGIKSEWELFGVKARTNIDGFHTDYSNIQRTVVVEINGITAPLTENAASATIDGIELEQAISPAPRTEVLLSYSYLRAKYDRFVSPLLGDLSRQAFPYTPRNKVSLSGRYHLPFSPRLGDVSMVATYAFQSSMSGQAGGGPNDSIRGYGLLNLRLNWDRIFGSPMNASLFVTNAANKAYVTRISETYNAYGVAGAAYGEPRIISGQLRYRFGP